MTPFFLIAYESTETEKPGHGRSTTPNVKASDLSGLMFGFAEVNDATKYGRQYAAL
jgi:phage-related protein